MEQEGPSSPAVLVGAEEGAGETPLPSQGGGQTGVGVLGPHELWGLFHSTLSF